MMKVTPKNLIPCVFHKIFPVEKILNNFFLQE